MQTKKKPYSTPLTERIDTLANLPSLLTAVSTIPTVIDGDWVEFREIENDSEWTS